VKLLLARGPQSGFDPELLWLAVGLSTLGGVGLWLHLGLPTPACLLHATTGIPCPTCGTTRSLRALLGGDLPTAFAWNPLAATLWIAFGAFALYAATVVLARLPRVRIRISHPVEARLLRFATLGILAANWGYLWAAGR